MKTLLLLSLLCHDGEGDLFLNFTERVFELDGISGTLSPHGANWAGPIYELTTDDGERMTLTPHHFDHGYSLDDRTFTCDERN